jgi:DNA-binding CsgD family transcriptional regulator
MLAVADRRRREQSRLAKLSPREYEILGLLSEGLTGQAIARHLFLSPETVRTHIRNATRKLGAKTRVHAVALMLGGLERGGAPATG